MNYLQKEIDLHMHSCYSDDGEFTPQELVDKCVEKGIKTFSITDHNCARANAVAKPLAEAKGLTYIPGIEIDCIFQDKEFHMLGYDIDYLSKDFVAIEENIKEQAEQASYRRLEKTRGLGFEIEEADLHQLEEGREWKMNWTGELFAEVLLSKQAYQNHPLLSPYREGGSRSVNPYVSMYWDFYAKGKPCSADMAYPQLNHVVALIHKNGGKAVLAHPGQNLGSATELLDAIVACGIDGIEVHSGYHSKEQREYYLGKAKEYGLISTKGSDYHGRLKPSINIGD